MDNKYYTFCMLIVIYSHVVEVNSLLQQYGICMENRTMNCSNYCSSKGFYQGTCKTITIDESLKVDSTKVVNRRICLCSDSYQQDYRGMYWFSPGHSCFRQSSESPCKEFCQRTRIPVDLCYCRLSSCSFPKKFWRLPVQDAPSGVNSPLNGEEAAAGIKDDDA